MAAIEPERKVCPLSSKSINMLKSLFDVFSNTDMKKKKSHLFTLNQECISKKTQITWLIDKSALNGKSFGQYTQCPAIGSSSPIIKQLMLYPCGKNHHCQSYASVEVQFQNLPNYTFVECDMAVMGENGNIILSKAISGDISDLVEINFEDFCLKSNLDNYLVNNKLHLQCKIECISKICSCVSDKKIIKRLSRRLSKDYQISKSNKYMKSIFDSGRYSDVTLKINSKMIKCHKFILAAASPALSILLKSNKQKVIDMQDTAAAETEDLLSFIYTGNINLCNVGHVSKLYVEADKFGILNLKDVCSVYLNSILTNINVPYIFKLSREYGDEYLIKACLRFIQSNDINSLAKTFNEKL